MHETDDDRARLQDLLDASYASAGEHLRSIHTPDRRVSAPALVSRLQGMCLLVLATVSGDGRPFTGPVDGIFYRGHFYFGSDPESARFRHIRRRSAVSACHVPSEEFAVTVHGAAALVDLRAPETQGFRQTLLEIYPPRYGAEWEQFIDSGPLDARIEADKMFAFAMDLASK
jgi:uncharacterized pyridoxamine 5'-phosphate oxidase family protein